MDERDLQAKPEHWEVVVTFFEEHPELAKNKFGSTEGDAQNIKDLWHKLTDHLNSLGYGQKSCEKWQMAIGRWKSKVKGKAAVIRKNQNKTGGGLSRVVQLTSLEDRLMSAIGWRSVTGDQNLELGFGHKKPNPLVEATPPPLEAIPGPSGILKKDIIEPSELINLHHLHKQEPVPGPSGINEAIGPVSAIQKPEPAIRGIKRKRKQNDGIAQMHQENLKALNVINQTLTNIQKDFHVLVEYLTKEKK